MKGSILAWELFGTVVGAGMASGREIASFFSRYGVWSGAAIVAAVLTLFWLGGNGLPATWNGRWQGKLWHAASALLLAAAAGAMLAGAGEIAALVLPVRAARWIGMASTLTAAWLLARGTSSGLAWVSRVMMGVLAALIALGLLAEPMKAAVLLQEAPVLAVLRGMAYGGFNAALLLPVASASPLSQTEKTRSCLMACMVLTGLLALGNAVLLRHPALLYEEMPFIALMSRYGKLGYVTGACGLYLAVLSTLTACMRGLGCRPLWIPCILLVAAAGFSGVVDRLYPALGGICAAILLMGKIEEFFRKHFSFPR